MKSKIKLLDVVALLKPLQEAGLQAGQVGTVVEILKKDVFEVEFCDKQGKTLAMLPVQSNDLLVLQFELERA